MKEFFPFRLDPVIKCLWRLGETAEEERILLAPTAFALLQYLVDHAGQLVTQGQLLQAVWGDTHVQSQAVKHHIVEIRTALGDDSKAPRFIETLPRRGYRFIAPVRESGSGLDGQPLKPALRKLVGRDRVLNGGKEPYYPMLEAVGKLCRRSNANFIVETLATEAPTWL